MLPCPQAHFTLTSKVPNVLLIPSSAVPVFPVQLLPFLIALRWLNLIKFKQVISFIQLSIHKATHLIHHPSASPILSSSLHPSTHSSIQTFSHLLFNHFQDSSSTKFVWYFYYYAMETEYTHNMLAILFFLINQIIYSPLKKKKKKNWRLSWYQVCTGYSWGYGNCLNWVMKSEWAFSR